MRDGSPNSHQEYGNDNPDGLSHFSSSRASLSKMRRNMVSLYHQYCSFTGHGASLGVFVHSAAVIFFERKPDAYGRISPEYDSTPDQRINRTITMKIGRGGHALTGEMEYRLFGAS